MRPRLFGFMLFATLTSAGAASALDDQPLQQKINACHAVADRELRMSCYDRLAEPSSSAGMTVLPTPTPMADRPPAPQVMAMPQAPVAAQVPVTAQAPAQALPQASIAMQTPPPVPVHAAPQTSESLRHDTDEILLAIASVSVGDNNMLRFVTSDGIPWEQSEDKPIHHMPAPGDLVKISRSYFGYTCKLSKHDEFHCKPPKGLNGRMAEH